MKLNISLGWRAKRRLSNHNQFRIWNGVAQNISNMNVLAMLSGWFGGGVDDATSRYESWKQSKGFRFVTAHMFLGWGHSLFYFNHLIWLMLLKKYYYIKYTAVWGVGLADKHNEPIDIPSNWYSIQVSKSPVTTQSVWISSPRESQLIKPISSHLLRVYVISTRRHLFWVLGSRNYPLCAIWRMHALSSQQS